jgi:type I restriction enzyme S subunit
MSEITDFIEARYADCGEEGERLVDALENLWEAFRPLADPEFVAEFCSGNETRFLERFSEMYLSGVLIEQDFQLSSSSHGPDIRVDTVNAQTWLEIVTPAIGEGPNQLPEDYANPDFTESAVRVYSVPHEAILLRWTSSIRQKWEKFEQYRAEAIIAEGDP